jgi:hypothetical protein
VRRRNPDSTTLNVPVRSSGIELNKGERDLKLCIMPDQFDHTATATDHERDKMPKIPHGTTLAERVQYATKVKAVATSFYDNKVWKIRNSNADVVLVEVWQRGKDVSIHPSRNQFFPVRDLGQKQLWHSLATDPRTMALFQSGREARAVRQHVAPPQKHHPKPLSVPSWARKQDLIGYTSSKPAAVSDLASLITLLGAATDAAHPSVYYWNGHATIDHSTRGNIGWEYGSGWQCLFFGNVPKGYV